MLFQCKFSYKIWSQFSLWVTEIFIVLIEVDLMIISPLSAGYFCVWLNLHIIWSCGWDVPYVGRAEFSWPYINTTCSTNCLSRQCVVCPMYTTMLQEDGVRMFGKSIKFVKMRNCWVRDFIHSLCYLLMKWNTSWIFAFLLVITSVFEKFLLVLYRPACIKPVMVT